VEVVAGFNGLLRLSFLANQKIRGVIRRNPGTPLGIL
jgi:hypothetical protein